MESRSAEVVRQIAAAQSGVISRQQAATAGLTPDAIDNKLRYLRWQRLQQGIYATHSGSPDRLAQMWAVVLRAGPRAALSFRTAAELYGLESTRGDLIHVTVPRNQRVRPIRGAVIHYSQWVDERRHPMLRPPRTRLEDTVLDLTQVAASFDDAFDWLSRAIGRRLTTPAQLRAAIDTRPRVRWRDDLLLALGYVADGLHSSLERLYAVNVERPHGILSAVRQAKVVADGKVRYLDNFYEQAQLAVELDGRAAHPPEQRRADNERDNALAALGILTVRYGWTDVTTRPCLLAAQVGQLLQLRGAAVNLRRCGPACAVFCER
jgi:very-short-patch-repair endonuclease/predicted transcriptional regulator of viral defense system